jgi:hypothetical protein
MVTINFRLKDKTLSHKLQNVIFLPNAPNCLISVSQFDKKGGRIIFHKGQCFLEGKDKSIIGHGVVQGRLYLIDAAAAKSNECSLYASSPKISWDQWH